MALSRPYLFLLFLSLSMAAGCGGSSPDRGFAEESAARAAGDAAPLPPVRTGAEVLLDRHLPELKGLRVGLLMNPTSRIDGTHMLDTLLARGVDVTALFASEHGFRGEAGAGETIEGGVDRATGLPVFSLYGDTRRPTPEMMGEVDLILADMPDVGARFYTYSTTLGYVLEEAAGAEVPVWVLDRPNPAGGDYVAGWMSGEEFRSFVGRYPVPMIHGLTTGELALMMKGERWIAYDAPPELRVIPMEGWERGMRWPETGLPWIAPSPNLPEFENAFLYLGTVLFEGTVLSEGRGTPQPFLTIGSPATDLPQEAIDGLNDRFPGVHARPATFTPRSIPGKAVNPKHEGVLCRGVSLELSDVSRVDPLRFGLALLEVMLEHTEGAEINSYMQNLTGIANDSLRAWLEGYPSAPDWQEGVSEFRKQRMPYLIY